MHDRSSRLCLWQMGGDRTYNWALLGPGRFAREFAADLATVPRAHRAVVASRSGARAAAFAESFGFERSADSYETVFTDESIDIVYIVIPHPFHRALAERAIESGKAVVCEKPLTLCAADTESLTSRARGAGVFLMEAMKTGFLPAVQQARRWIDDGAVGEVQSLHASFSFAGSVDPSDRLLNPDLGGGAILDVGIYPLYLAQRLLGEVDSLHAVGRLSSTGVEETAVASIRHRSGACSALTCSFRSAEAMDAVVLGELGTITIPRFHAAATATVKLQDGTEETFIDPQPALVRHEIEAVHAALDAGLVECPGHTHADSLRLARLMDTAVAQVRRP